MDALTALRFQIEWGADEAVADTPTDRLHPLPRHPPPAPAAAATTLAHPAEACRSLADIEAALDTPGLCPLSVTATHRVRPAGPPNAHLLVIDDVPGADEDRTGTPLSGPAGAFFDRMLASIGLSRAELAILPVIPWRPPGQRPPAPDELAACLPFLRRALALRQPRIVLTLGAIPLRALLGPAASLSRVRGKWQEQEVALLPMQHPKVIASTPAAKRQAWADLRTLKRRLDAP